MSRKRRKIRRGVLGYQDGGDLNLIPLGDGTFRNSQGDITDAQGNIVQRANVGNITRLKGITDTIGGISESDIINPDDVLGGVGNSRRNIGGAVGRNAGALDSLGDILSGIGQEGSGDSEFSDTAGQVVGTAIGAINPVLGGIVKVGQGLGKVTRGSGRSLGRNLVSDLVANPSHAFFESIDSGDPLEQIPGLGTLRRTRRKNREESERIEEIQQKKLGGLRFLAEQRGIALAGQTNNFKGQRDTGFFKGGGRLNGRHGIDLLNGSGKEISDGVFLTQGASHDRGGISLDLDNDNIPDAEVEGGEILDTNRGIIFSDTLKPTEESINRIKSNLGISVKGTFSEVSEKLNKEKNKFQNPENINRDINTSSRMLSRINQLEEGLFRDQQNQNNNNGGENARRGGLLDTVVNKQSDPVNSRFLDTKIDSRSFRGGGEFFLDSKKSDSRDFGFREGGRISSGQNGLNLDLEAKRIAHINNLGLSGSDDEVLSFRRRLMTEESKTKDRLSQFFPSSFTSQIQKALPNTQDRLNPKLVRKFMTDFNKSESTINPTNIGIPQGQFGLDLNNINPELISGGLGALNLAANRRAIGQLETEFTPNLVAAQPFTFQDTRSAQERRNAEATRQVLNTIDSSSTQTQAAAKAGLLANRLRADSEVNIRESQRRDAALGRFRSEESRRNIINANIANQAASANLARRNQLVGLGQGARNQFIEDVQANRQLSIVNQTEKDRALLTALQQGDRGTIDRLLRDNPELARRLGLSNFTR